MRRRGVYLTVAGLAAVSLLGDLLAQPLPAVQQARADQITLVYEREVYAYTGGARRDPFQPLTDDDQVGPRFEDLALQGIMYSDVRGQSLALLTAGERVFRARVGDVIGNSRVIEIGPRRLVLAVETFGSIRQEILELPPRGGADR